MGTTSGSSGKMPDDTGRKTDTGSLPKGYGKTNIILLPRDPNWAFAYWELTDGTKQQIRDKYGADIFSKSQMTLRVYDVTDIIFDGNNANNFFDITVNEFAENWYINIQETNRSLVVDLGLKLTDGRFITIVRSNVVSMPRQGISPITDAQWAIVQHEFERLLKLSGIDKIGVGSFDVAKLMKERWEELMSISSAGMPFSARSVSSFREKHEEEKSKDFWLKANTELIVYGATESDAKLKLQNVPLKLNADGTFSVRFALNDGKIDIPIEAVSADGTMERKIKFVVTRKTS